MANPLLETELNNIQEHGPGFSHEQGVFRVSMTLGADGVKLLRTESVGVQRACKGFASLPNSPFQKLTYCVVETFAINQDGIFMGP